MEEIKTLLKKIKNFELVKSDLDKLILFLKSISPDKPIVKSLIDDSIEWLKVISFLLKKYETGKFAIIGDDWRKEGIEFQKLKRIIDEMDYEGFLTHILWGIGGNCHFELIDKQDFLEFLYNKLESILLRIAPKISEDGKLIIESFDQISQIKESIIIPKTKVTTEKIQDKPHDTTPTIPRVKKSHEERPHYFVTNLKHIEDELEETVKKLSKFYKSQAEIEKWISQFKTDKERKYALKLLNNFRYYSDENMINLFSQSHKNLLFEFDEVPKINDFLFIPAGGAGSSGAKCTPYYRDFNNIGESQIKNYDNLNKLDKKYNYVVFIDDFIGTGNQANDFFKNIDFDNLKSSGIEKIYFVTLAAFEEGIKLIEKNYKDLKVITVERFDDRDKAFSKSSKVFLKEEKEEAEKIFKSYGNKLCKEMPLGYGDFAALISFKHKSPNHTLPVIWSDARGWFPIFKRYYHL